MIIKLLTKILGYTKLIFLKKLFWMNSSSSKRCRFSLFARPQKRQILTPSERTISFENAILVSFYNFLNIFRKTGFLLFICTICNIYTNEIHYLLYTFCIGNGALKKYQIIFQLVARVSFICEKIKYLI